MRNFFYIALILLAFSCKTHYQPTLKALATNYLVVEGIINSSKTDSTLIKLSRTISLTSSVTTKPEPGAQVSVEDGQGFIIVLQEMRNGNYVAAPLGLDNTKKYRLRIKTSDNKTYLSDLIGVAPTPPIDSVGFYNKDTGIQIYVNTHDPNNNTRYYRWDFTETWKFLPTYISKYRTNGVAIVERTPEQMYPGSCWGNDISKNVVVNSSVKLSQDVIYQAPLTYIDGTSDKISLRYSILVKQYALTKEAYTFWDQLRKNTESLGSIFDAQPSEVSSNIHCVDNLLEPVLGYISVSNVQSKRVYFNKSDLHIFTVSDEVTNCRLDTMYNSNPVTKEPQVKNNLIPLGSELIPVDPFYGLAIPPIGYLSTSRKCVDCSVRGGIKPPSFWRDY